LNPSTHVFVKQNKSHHLEKHITEDIWVYFTLFR
jgi:hypothetical protein